MLQTFALKLHHNRRADPAAGYGSDLQSILSLKGHAAALREVSAWPGYAPTPLIELPGLARAAGIGRLWYKDEATRFGLGSFKALGGAYAVYRLLAAEIARRRRGAPPSSADLLAGRHRDIAADITVATATDGNHGRSVAWGAQLFGARAVIYIHATVSEGRRAAIARYGAEVVRVAGNYDDSVHQVAADAARHGWFVVSDTSYPGYRDIPCQVMQGYSIMAGEVIDQLPTSAGQTTRPTHAFIQGGVGGLAAAVLAQLWESWGPRAPALPDPGGRPRTVAVEPERADCLYQSALHGQPTKSPGDLDTLMAGLAAGEVSLAAWDVLDRGCDDFLVIPDAAAVQAMRLLAEGLGGDRPVVGGEAGVGGLAGLLAAAADREARPALGLDETARVLVIGSEGDTDAELYGRIVGRTGDAVRAAAANWLAR
ncbi:MAG: diaminopropionate ammonia-lyase [Alphaproteobacteria bacterium]|nr:diaminopropionate ammonia-lyase [Alphaproteobacteria bacterium]